MLVIQVRSLMMYGFIRAVSVAHGGPTKYLGGAFNVVADLWI